MPTRSRACWAPAVTRTLSGVDLDAVAAHVADQHLPQGQVAFGRSVLQSALAPLPRTRCVAASIRATETPRARGARRRRRSSSGSLGELEQLANHRARRPRGSGRRMRSVHCSVSSNVDVLADVLASEMAGSMAMLTEPPCDSQRKARADADPGPRRVRGGVWRQAFRSTSPPAHGLRDSAPWPPSCSGAVVARPLN